MKTQNYLTRRDPTGAVAATSFSKDYCIVNGEGKSQEL